MYQAPFLKFGDREIDSQNIEDYAKKLLEIFDDCVTIEATTRVYKIKDEQKFEDDSQIC